MSVRHGERVLWCDPHGRAIDGDRTAMDLIADAFDRHATTIVLPLARLDPRFFVLRSGVAGEVVQKFANYRVRLVVLGDITEHLERGTAFRDFVGESNRNTLLWFVADESELDARLAARAG
jgi:hypothetical protein